MQIFTGFRFINIVHANFLKNFPCYIKTQARFRAMQFMTLLLPRSLFLVPIFSQPDLFEDSHEKFVHVMLDPTGRFYEFTFS